jgi:hypothetical protein
VGSALLVGGVGANTATLGVTEPTGWTELVDGRGAQVTDLAYQASPVAVGTAGATAGGGRRFMPAAKHLPPWRTTGGR